MIVMKFGGSSVDGADRMRAAASIVAGRKTDRPVVITSAMRGVTDELGSLVETALEGERAALEEGLTALGERHRRVALALAEGDASLLARIDDLLRELRVLLRGVRLLGQATPRSRDAILGFGELLSQELLAAALAGADCRPAVVDARDVLVTDDRFGAARPDLEGTRERVQAELLPLVDDGVVPVLGGYLGATRAGVPTTLGRGGSDLSASVLGLALAARRVEIWTDVDGLLSADPRVVASARPLRHVTFREAAELATFGAKVLHPASIDPALQGGLEVVVLNSHAPQRPGTRIGRALEQEAGAAAVAMREGLVGVRVRAPGRSRRPGFLAAILEVLADEGLVPLALTPGPVGVDMLLVDDPGLRRLHGRLARFGSIEMRRPLAIVALVGELLAERPDRWAEILSRCAGTPVSWLVHGPNGASIGLVVEEGAARSLMESLHREFVEATLPGVQEEAT